MKNASPKFINQNQKKRSWKRNENLDLFKKSKLNKKFMPKKEVGSFKKSLSK